MSCQLLILLFPFLSHGSCGNFVNSDTVHNILQAVSTKVNNSNFWFLHGIGTAVTENLVTFLNPKS